jgi:hypothetical protein
MTPNVTAEELHEKFNLDLATGLLTWRERQPNFFAGEGWMRERAAKTWNSRFAGRGMSKDEHGYFRAHIMGKHVRVHRIVFAMTNGRWPISGLDHINGDPSDNRPENLREVTQLENCRNQKLRAGNKFGIHGISIDKRTGKFVSSIFNRGRKVHIGQYGDLLSAIASRQLAEVAFGYHSNHGRV